MWRGNLPAEGGGRDDPDPGLVLQDVPGPAGPVAGPVPGGVRGYSGQRNVLRSREQLGGDLAPPATQGG